MIIIMILSSLKTLNFEVKYLCCLKLLSSLCEKVSFDNINFVFLIVLLFIDCSFSFKEIIISFSKTKFLSEFGIIFILGDIESILFLNQLYFYF